MPAEDPAEALPHSGSEFECRFRLATRNAKLETAFMTWVKICGTTNLEDARAAVAAGADAVGFVFAPSPRRIPAAEARRIIADLPPQVEKIGVFANESAERIREIVEEAGLSAVQLHGDESLQFVRDLHSQLNQRHEVKLIRALKLPPLETASLQTRPGEAIGWDPFGPGMAEIDEQTHQLQLGPIAAILLDSAGPEGRGGTGKRFDWDAARRVTVFLNLVAKVIAAGGLTPANVAEAIAALRPWGVDVCSGVECEPGRKDHAKLRAFVAVVREASLKL